MSDLVSAITARRERGWLFGVVLLLAALLLGACGGEPEDGLNPDILSNYLPADWKPITVDKETLGFQTVNFDGDGDKEWLYFFHYDSQTDQANGPIGGIIYDAQPNADVLQPAAFFVPYRLLPDWREGKGQGYLGETTVNWSQAWVDPTDQTRPADELVVVGYSPGNVATRLSLFRWLDQARGYGVAQFRGSYSLQALPADRQPGVLIAQVVTLNSLNDRSRLCQQVLYTRQGDATATFSPSLPRIVFCLGAQGLQTGVPEQPTYPEAVVLAWLLGGQNEKLVLPGQNEALKAVLGGSVQRVVSIDYPGAASAPAPGVDAVSVMAVQTLVETENGSLNLQWNLQERSPTGDDKTSRWRIVSAQRIP